MYSFRICIFLLMVLILLKTSTGSNRPLCIEEHISVIIPYISSKNGTFISEFNNSINSLQELFVSFKWRNGITTVLLQKSKSYSPTANVVWQDDDLTMASSLHDSCLYQGNVVGIPGSLAALSICDNVNGYVLTNSFEFIIESMDDEYQKTGLHRLTVCKVDVSVQKNSHHRKRHRRETKPSQYLEVLVAADTSVVRFVGKDKLEKYLMTIMNIVNTIYKHDTLDVKIEVVTTGLILMDSSDEKTVLVKNDARLTVDKFCAWISGHPKHTFAANHDVAVMITRNGIGPAGYAPITGMCNPRRSCAVVKDEGFTSAFIIAHEIAHVIGIYHDGHGNDCHGREFQYSMMASMVQSTLQHYWWSRCSNQRMNQVIPYLTCLNNDPFEDPMKGVEDPLGKPFSLDDQCRYEFGENHMRCKSYYGDLCETLWCVEKSNLQVCKTKRGRPLNGTQCSSGQYWCMEGKCVYHGYQKPKDGGWGSWGSWSACSANCEVGIKERSRKCDDPRPSYGGKPCEGENKDVYTCSSGNRCKDYTDLRALQCGMLSGINIRGRSHTWLPYQKEKETDQCKFTCVSNETKQVQTFHDMTLEDGTPCTYEHPNNICVKGKCWKVGCEGQMNSSVEYDKCGICGGNGSECKVVQGIYEKTFNYKQWPPDYQRILLIPENSRGIEISEDKSTSHFLAVKDPAYGLYYLNGGRRASSSRKLVMNGAWFTYENKWNRETLTSEGPLRRPLQVMILPQNKYQAARVSYQYTVKADDFTFEKSKYEWVFDHWTDCSVTCGVGTQHIVNKCIDKDTKDDVEKEKCKFVGSETGIPTKCERTACEKEKYTWAMDLTWSECSVTCGEGVETQEYRCEESTSDGNFITVEPKNCNPPPPNFTRPCKKGLCHYFQWESLDEWTDCPVTCGTEGLQYEHFRCNLVSNGERTEVEDKFCEMSMKPNISRPCRLEPCYEIWYQWGFNHKWTKCSELCGDNGVQYPVFFCEQIDSHGFSDIVDNLKCNHLVPPENVTKPCNRESCIFEWFQWSYGNWTDCSVICGDSGNQKRDFYCERAYSNGTIESVNNYMCDDLVRPIYMRECSGPPCLYSTFRLSYTSEWDECTTTCGDLGIQTQKAICEEVMPNGTVLDVSIYMCDDLVSLSELRPCNRVPCETYKWTAAPFWTNCTAECGDNGLMYQMHYCDKVLSDGTTQFVHFDHCASLSMPFVTKNCNRRPCALEWGADEWTKCSVTCGKGVQRRHVFCGNPEADSNDTMCPGLPPANTMECEIGPCPLYDETCVDKFSFCNRTASDRRCRYRGFRNRCCSSCSGFA